MRLLPWLLLAVALAMVAGLTELVRSSVSRTPADYLAAAEVLLARTPPEIEAATRELAFGIELAEQSGDDASLADLLRTRGQMYRRQRALAGAKSDFERLLALPEIDVLSTYVELAELDLVAEDYAGAIEVATNVLDGDPENASAFEVRGEARRLLGLEQMAQVEALIYGTLDRDAAAVALGIAERIVHLPGGRPVRAALGNQLERHFAGPFERQAAELAPLLDAASKEFAAARADFMAALTHSIRRDSVFHLLESLLSSGETGAVVDLGLALRMFKPVATDVRTIELLARALAIEGRPRAAAQIVATAAEPGDLAVSRDFLPVWAEILYRSESWGPLLDVVADMSARFASGERFKPERDAANFYRGMAAHRLGNFGPAANSLKVFVNGVPSEPIPDAVAIALATLASIEAEVGSVAAHRDALNRLTSRAPDYSGEAWLQLADLRESTSASASSVLNALTEAIRLSPLRAEELFERWYSVGEQHLLDSGRDLNGIQKGLLRQGLWVSPKNADPYERYRLAELWSESRRFNGTASACRQILDTHADFLPALDLLIEAEAALGRPDLAADLLLHRQQIAPGSAWGLERLRELDSAGVLDSTQTLELIRLDPELSGLFHLGGALLEQGGAELVSDAFAEGAGDRSSAARLLAARSEALRGRPQRVIDLLAEVDPQEPDYCEAFGLRLTAALETSSAAVERVVDAFGSPTHPVPGPLLESLDALLAEGAARPARRLAEALDQDGAIRDDSLVARLALAQLVDRDFRAARETFERALAFREDGFVEVGELLMAVQEERWSDIRRAALAVRASAWPLGALDSCLLSALEGRLVEALENAREGERNQVAGAPWGLARAAVEALAGEPLTRSDRHGPGSLPATERMLLGTPAAPRDPRTALAILFALDSPDWAPWAEAQMADAGPEAGPLWPLYLRALADRELDRTDRARARLQALTEKYPGFAPAWDRLEELELERLARIEHPELLALRAARATALGAQASDTIDQELSRASGLLATNRVVEAAKVVQGVLAREPAHPVGTLLLGRLQLAVGQAGAAVETFGRFIASVPRDVSFEYVPEFLTLLEAARRTGVLSEGALAAELGALEALHPADPYIAAARAERELRLAGDNLALGLSRAFDTLDEFEAAQGRASLDSLREGSSARWFELFVSYDPERAQAFVESQLDRSPDQLDLWRLLGRALETQGREPEALAHYELVGRMVPDGWCLLREATLLAELGSDHARVVATLQRVRKLEERSTADPELVLVESLSMVSAGGPLLDEGIARLSGLWERRTQPGFELDAGMLGRALGVALLQRGQAADRGLARSALELSVGGRAPGTSDLDVEQLLLSLATRIP